MRTDHYTSVRPKTISQDMRKSKDTLKKNNILKSRKNMTIHQILIVNQAMMSQPIRNLMIRKASRLEITS